MNFFETERLRLRNVIPEDVDVMFDYRNNEICSRYQSVRRHIVGGENRTLISVKIPLRLCRIGTCRRLKTG